MSQETLVHRESPVGHKSSVDLAGRQNVPERRNPPISIRDLISLAEAHISLHGPTVNRARAVDKILRTPPPTTPDINEALVNERRHAGVPSYIDPESFYRSMQRQSRLSLTKLQEIEDQRETTSTKGNGIRAHWDAAKTIILDEWTMRDNVKAEQKRADNEAKLIESQKGAAQEEDERERMADQPLPRSGVVYTAAA